MKWTVQSAGARNTRSALKPNEDAYLADAQHGIFIVADGVTMSADDYHEGMQKSPAGMAAEIAVQSIHESLLAMDDANEALKAGLNTAIGRCADMNAQHPTEYPACAVLVACCIRDGRVYCGYMGDSQAFILRKGARIPLTERQTARLNAYYAAHGNRPDKRYIYDHITNHIEHPLSYGVVMGDMRVMDLLLISSMVVEPGDRLIISTDGMEDYLLFAGPNELKNLSAEEMLSRSLPYDEPPYAKFADDKSIILVDIEA